MGTEDGMKKKHLHNSTTTTFPSWSIQAVRETAEWKL